MHRNDLARLASRAREAIGDALSATLLVEGIGRLDGDAIAGDVALREDAGRPAFVCPLASPLVLAGRRRARAMLTVAAADADLMTVVIAGQLRVGHGEQHNETSTAVVELMPASVIVELDPAGSDRVLTYEIPLECYHRAVEDALLACGRRLAAHTTDAHQDELRVAAARFARRRGVGAIAGAELADVDGTARRCGGSTRTAAARLDCGFAPARRPRAS